MKYQVFVSAVIATIFAFAAETQPQPKQKRVKDMTPEEYAKYHLEVQARRLKRTGGYVVRPGSQKGKIVFYNAQKLVPAEKLDENVKMLARETKYNIVMSEGEKILQNDAPDAMKKLGADIAVFIVEDESSPLMSIMVPDSGFAIVNASAVCKGARNDVFRAARLKKAMLRAFYCAAGAMNSQYPASMTSSIRTAQDLDRLLDDPPMDVFGRTVDNLTTLGVTQEERSTYLRACRAGWAPAPTNDIQKAIWDSTHQKK